jgi:beta-glucuronidase
MLPGVQDYHNRKGVISNRGQPKLAFYTLQTFYKKQADEGKQSGVVGLNIFF